MVKKKLLDHVTEVARFRHLSLRTEAAYRNWIKRFILFHHKCHPRELDADVESVAPSSKQKASVSSA
ncbi:MAG TPA: phage integrase N-terminal SAM-like domain-containing protein [Pyrinomonadaceae bacterium]|nr:phage integrase N-terminal SAM-like domain-containing protein [Pyrinomonadaceae bacterium]